MTIGTQPVSCIEVPLYPHPQGAPLVLKESSRLITIHRRKVVCIGIQTIATQDVIVEDKLSQFPFGGVAQE